MGGSRDLKKSCYFTSTSYVGVKLLLWQMKSGDGLAVYRFLGDWLYSQLKTETDRLTPRHQDTETPRHIDRQMDRQGNQDTVATRQTARQIYRLH